MPHMRYLTGIPTGMLREMRWRRRVCECIMTITSSAALRSDAMQGLSPGTIVDRALYVGHGQCCRAIGQPFYISICCSGSTDHRCGVGSSASDPYYGCWNSPTWYADILILCLRSETTDHHCLLTRVILVNRSHPSRSIG